MMLQLYTAYEMSIYPSWPANETPHVYIRYRCLGTGQENATVICAHTAAILAQDCHRYISMVMHKIGGPILGNDMAAVGLVADLCKDMVNNKQKYKGCDRRLDRRPPSDHLAEFVRHTIGRVNGESFSRSYLMHELPMDQNPDAYLSPNKRLPPAATSANESNTPGANNENQGQSGSPPAGGG